MQWRSLCLWDGRIVFRALRPSPSSGDENDGLGKTSEHDPSLEKASQSASFPEPTLLGQHSRRRAQLVSIAPMDVSKLIDRHDLPIG